MALIKQDAGIKPMATQGVVPPTNATSPVAVAAPAVPVEAPALVQNLYRRRSPREFSLYLLHPDIGSCYTCTVRDCPINHQKQLCKNCEVFLLLPVITSKSNVIEYSH